MTIRRISLFYLPVAVHLALSMGAAGHTQAASLKRIHNPPVNDATADETDRDSQIDPVILDLTGGELIAAFTDTGSSTDDTRRTGFAWSNDMGLGWTDGGALPTTAAGDGGTPALAYDRGLKRAYLATGSTYGDSLGGRDIIHVFRSDDKGHSWQAPVNGAPGFVGSGDSLASGSRALAVDNFTGVGKGNIYLCSTRFPLTPSEWDHPYLVLSSSTDGGATFALKDVPASDGFDCAVAVAPDHSVHIVYFHENELGDRAIYTRKSTEGGANFGDAKLLANLNTDSRPRIAINPNPLYPFVFVVYEDDPTPDDPADNSDVYLVKSLDGGQTWSAPAKVSDDTSGDQFSPAVATTAGGARLMISYTSGVDDPGRSLSHLRGRFAVMSGNGTLTFDPSFQFSPNTPFVKQGGGSTSHIAGGAGIYSVVWSDTRSSSRAHDHQHDIRFAQFTAPTTPADVALTGTYSTSGSTTSFTFGQGVATWPLGETVTLTGRLAVGTAAASDVYFNLPPTPGIKVLSATPSGGSCTVVRDSVGCALGTMAASTRRTVTMVLKVVGVSGSRTMRMEATTSSRDPIPPLNNTRRQTVSVTNGSAVTKVLSVAGPRTIANGSTLEVPVTVPQEGTMVNLKAVVRLNHSSVDHIRLSLVSPAGTITDLSLNNVDWWGGSANYGSGANNCQGNVTTFDDRAGTSIVTASAPFVGTFRPEEPLAEAAGAYAEGVWKLRIANSATSTPGTFGCFRLFYTYVP